MIRAKKNLFIILDKLCSLRRCSTSNEHERDFFSRSKEKKSNRRKFLSINLGR